MESSIARVLNLKHEPVAIILTDQKPQKAKQFKPGKFSCVMFLLAAVVRGDTAVFDRETFGCPGGGTGLGFGNQYKSLPGGEEWFSYFLSVGNEGRDEGLKLAKLARPFMTGEMYDNLVHGERYIKTPELVLKFIECLPITDIPYGYVVFKPLKYVNPDEEAPEVVIFLADMDQLGALVALANYERETNENVIIPQAAGCQAIGIYPFREARAERPRAVVGLMDVAARLAIKRQLKDDVISFAMPFALFQEMEANVPGSFLERITWKELLKLKK
ncbi:MAG: DUF169 domain-containing protein [Chloroflexota bacterium]